MIFSREYKVEYFSVDTKKWRSRTFPLLAGAIAFCKKSRCLVKVYQKEQDVNRLIYSGSARKFPEAV